MGKQKLFLWQRLPLPHPCGRSVWTVTAPHGGWGTPPPQPAAAMPVSAGRQHGHLCDWPGPLRGDRPGVCRPGSGPVPAACPQPCYYPADSVSYRSAGSPRGLLWPRASGVSGMRGSPTEAGSDPGGRALGGRGALSPHGEHSAAGSQTPLGSAHGGPRQPGVLPAEQLRSPHWDSKQIDWLFELLSHKTAPQTAPRWREAHATGRRGSGSERGASPSPPPGVPAPAGAATEGPAVHPAPPLLPPSHRLPFALDRFAPWGPSASYPPPLSLPVLDLPHTQELPGFAANRLHARVKKPDCPGLPLRVLRVTTGRSALGARLAPRFLCSHSPHSLATRPPRSDCPIFSEREGDVSGKKKDVSDEGHTQTH